MSFRALKLNRGSVLGNVNSTCLFTIEKLSDCALTSTIAANSLTPQNEWATIYMKLIKGLLQYEILLLVAIRTYLYCESNINTSEITPDNLSTCSRLLTDDFHYGTSAMSTDVSGGALRGRPHGGVFEAKCRALHFAYCYRHVCLCVCVCVYVCLCVYVAFVDARKTVWGRDVAFFLNCAEWHRT